MHRTLVGMIFTAGLLLASAPAASGASLVADFRFQNTLQSSTPDGPTLQDTGTLGSAFATEEVNGEPRTVYRFPDGAGVSFNSSGLVPRDDFSLVVLFNFDQTAGYKRIVDLKARASDRGLYALNDALSYFPLGVGSPSTITPDRYVQVALVRNAAAGTVTGYVDGVQQFSFSADVGGADDISAADVLNFFLDDLAVPNEDSAGEVARIRAYAGPLTAAEVAALGRVPDTTPPMVTMTAPAAGTETSDATPTYAGVAGALEGDLDNVIVKVFAGPAATGAPVQTLTATRSGALWTVEGATDLAAGTYTARAEQSDAAGNTGLSNERTFTVDTVAPQTTIDSGPAGPTADATPTFGFSSEAGATSACRVDDGPLTPCTSPHTTAPLADGPHTFAVAATDAAGNTDATPATRSFTVNTVAPVAPDADGDRDGVNDEKDNCVGVANPRQEDLDGDGLGDACDATDNRSAAAPLLPPALAPGPPGGADRDRDTVGDATDNCPDAPNAAQADRDADGIGDACDASDASPGPTLGSTVVAQVVSGTVFVRLPASPKPGGVGRAAQAPRGFVALKGAEVLPVGTLVDTGRGRLALTSAAAVLQGRTQTQRAEFFDGIFQIRQKRARQPVTDIVLRSAEFPQVCGSRTRGADAFAAQRERKVVSRLGADGTGRFRTVGRHSAATVRGTIWLTEERCDGTLTRVRSGVVSVRDLVARKTVTVRAGGSYLARAARASVKTRRR